MTRPIRARQRALVLPSGVHGDRALSHFGATTGGPGAVQLSEAAIEPRKRSIVIGCGPGLTHDGAIALADVGRASCSASRCLLAGVTSVRARGGADRMWSEGKLHHRAGTASETP